MNTALCVWNLEIGLQAGYILLNTNGQENCLPEYRITHTGARELGRFCWTTFNLKDTPHSVTLGSSLCGSWGDHPTLKSVGNSSHCHLSGCLSGPNSLLLQDLRLCSIDWRCLQSINTKREVGGRCWGQKRCTLERPSLAAGSRAHTFATAAVVCEHWKKHLGSAAAHYLVYVLSWQGQRDEENWFV